MPGSTSPWDQHEDPRDNTVDLPRIDVDGLTDYFRRAAPMLEPEPAGLLEPLPDERAAPLDDLRHPYAEPTGEPRRPSVWQAVERPTRAADPGPAPTSASTARQAPPGPEADLAPSTPEITPAAQTAGPPAKSAAPVRPAAAATESEVSAPSAEPRRTAAEPEVSAPSAEPRRTAAEPPKPAASTSVHARSAGVGPADRAPAGSLADLRSRLARLPDGHPSSPYEDDGRVRPLPIRLKQLELGLPPPARELAAGRVPNVEADDVQPDHAQVLAEPERPRTPAGSPGEQAAGASSTSDPVNADLRAAEVPAPEARPSDELPSAVGADSTRPSGSGPARPTVLRPNAANGPGAPDSAPPQRGAELTLGPWQSTRSHRVGGLEGVSHRGRNGHRPSNGLGNGYERESQGQPDLPNRAADDSDRRDTARHHIASPPSADVHELVDRTLATCRTAEGRNAIGSYGNSGLTPAMQRLAANLPFGGLAPGSEANSLKSPERLSAKLTRLIARNPGRTAEELAAAVGDVVRFAFAFEAADYVEGTWLVHRRLKSHGFELEIRRNRWESPERKGIFTQWRDPAHDVAFEVQFHTTASWAVLQRTHDAYVQITDPATPPAERGRLRAQQVAAAVAAKAPHNWAEFDDFRLEAR